MKLPLLRYAVYVRLVLAAFASLFCVTITALGMQEESLKPVAQPLYDQCKVRKSTVAGKRIVDAQAVKLKSSSRDERIRAVGALAASCDARATPLLTGLLKEDKDPAVRAAAVTALGHLGDPDSIEPLRNAIADPDSRVLFELGPALCAFQDYKASYDTLNYLANPGNRPMNTVADLAARCRAILSLFQLQNVGFSRKAMHFLLEFLDHSDPAFRQLTMDTLREARKTKNGPHELVGILKQSNNPDFKMKAAFWIGELKIESGRDLLTEVSANDRDYRLRREAEKALAKLGTARTP